MVVDNIRTCPAAFRSEAGAKLASKALNMLLIDDAGWEDAPLLGFVKGNVQGIVEAKSTRAIIPQNTFCKIGHYCMVAFCRTPTVGARGRGPTN